MLVGREGDLLPPEAEEDLLHGVVGVGIGAQLVQGQAEDHVLPALHRPVKEFLFHVGSTSFECIHPLYGGGGGFVTGKRERTAVRSLFSVTPPGG